MLFTTFSALYKKFTVLFVLFLLQILTTLRPVSTTTNNATNITTLATPFLTIVPAKVPTHIINHSPQPCEHIITTYLIPNILHFIAYALGFYFFRIQDNEQLYAMMEKVSENWFFYKSCADLFKSLKT